MKNGDESLDLERVREKKLEEGELNRMIAVAERASQMLFDLRGDSQTLDTGALRAERNARGKAKKGEKGGEHRQDSDTADAI